MIFVTLPDIDIFWNIIFFDVIYSKSLLWQKNKSTEKTQMHDVSSVVTTKLTKKNEVFSEITILQHIFGILDGKYKTDLI